MQFVLLHGTSSSFPQKCPFLWSSSTFFFESNFAVVHGSQLFIQDYLKSQWRKWIGKALQTAMFSGGNCPASQQRPLFWCRKAPGAAEATEDLGWHSEPRLWLRAPVIASESSRMFSSPVKAQRPKSLLTEPCKDPATPEAGCIKLIITFPFHQALFRFI